MDEGRMANGQTLDAFRATHCGVCMACPVCKRHVERDEEHVEGCSDRARIRGCTEPPHAVVMDKGFELVLCKNHWDEDPKNFVRFVKPDGTEI